MGTYYTETFERISEEKRRSILDAAAEEFSLYGFSAGNINVIARKAGVSVGSLYQYFGSKENCFLAVLEDGFLELKAVLMDTLASSQGPLEKIEAILRLIPEHTRRRKTVIRLYNELTGEGLTESVKAFCERFEALSAQTYAQLCREAVALGIASPDLDPETFAFFVDNIFMMLQFSYSSDYFILRRRVYLGNEKTDDDERLISWMLRFITKALTA